jgi:hypothetical protein
MHGALRSTCRIERKCVGADVWKGYDATALGHRCTGNIDMIKLLTPKLRTDIRRGLKISRDM